MRKALLSAGVMGVAWLALCPAALAAFPGANGKLAFATVYRGNGHEVYTMNADGSDLANLTNSPGVDTNPAWSPDGTKLAFTSGRDPGGYYEIYTMNADGSNPTKLTDNPSMDTHPAWSPDGTKLAFESTRDGNHEIYTMNPDGSGQTNITNNAGYDVLPAWSPDGTKLAFKRGGAIYTMNADGSNPTSIPNSATNDWFSSAVWSPDGTQLAFSIYVYSLSRYEIYTIDIDGSDRTLVTILGAGPAWSPDGTKMAFSIGRSLSDIYTINADGSNRTNLTNDQPYDYDVDWQPIVQRGYPRPKSAPSLRASLVPSFAACTSPNREHGPPLAEPSCAPPAQQSPRVTVGEPTVNTGPVDFSGVVRLNVLPGAPSTTADEADVLIRAVLTSVRCSPPSSLCGAPNDFTTPPDYAGGLEGAISLRITDRNNAPFPDPATGKGPGTVVDNALTFTIPCTETSSTSRGSACSVETTADALVPGMVLEQQRANWELGDVRVLDGGADGDPATPDGAQVFLRQGVAIP